MRSVFLIVVTAFLAFGQSDHANIFGIVSDPQARLVQHAEVQVRNMETGKEYRAESNETGHYRITALPAGTYEVSITLPHFEEVRVKDVKAGELQPTRVDLILRTK